MPATVPGVVVITGGSSGIGLATADLFAARGWRIGLIARGAVPLQAAAQRLSRAGAIVLTRQADVSDSAALEQAADAIEAELGAIIVWVNCAGISVFGRFDDIPAGEFERVTDVTYMGAVRGTRIALARMRRRDRGTIVNVCSAIGLRGVPLQSAYSGAKYAMRGFGEALRGELCHQNSAIRLSTVYPPSVNTPFYSHATARIDGLPRPPPPIYQPELVAKAVLFAAESGRPEVMVGAQTVVTGIANMLVPRTVSDRLAGWIAPPSQHSANQGIAEARDETLFTGSTRVTGTHGAFDRESLPFSLQAWGTRHRGLVGGAAVVLGLLAMARAGRD